MVKIFKYLFLLSVTFSACDNDLEVVRSLAKNDKQPDVIADNMEILYSDSAHVKGKVVAPEVLYFSSIQQPYIEYPKGIHVYFYNDSLKVIAEMSSKYAIYYEEKRLCEARTNVVVVNTKGEKLKTEQLFWDMNKKRISSQKYCSIQMPDGTQQNGEKGMDANEDFSQWNLFGARGSVNVDDPQ
jgi:LPS export ABC transporter protein LptC